MYLSELKALPVTQLVELAGSLDIENASRLRKQELMFAILKKKAKTGEQIFGDGVLEVLPDGFGFLRSPEASYLASTDDIYLSPPRFAASTFTPATRWRARFAPPKTVSATSHW